MLAHWCVCVCDVGIPLCASPQGQLIPPRLIVVLIHVRSAVTVVVDRAAVLEVLRAQRQSISGTIFHSSTPCTTGWLHAYLPPGPAEAIHWQQASSQPLLSRARALCLSVLTVCLPACMLACLSLSLCLCLCTTLYDLVRLDLARQRRFPSLPLPRTHTCWM